MAGRRPKPTRIKKISGNPGKRKLNANEPKPVVAIPECPLHLDDEARAEWNRVAPELHALGMIALINRCGLAAYCVAWSRWVDAETQLKTLGPVIKTSKGYPIQNPYLGVANTSMEQMRKWCTEFGMTPSSLARVGIGGNGVPAGKEHDEWKEFDSPTVN